MSQPHQFPNDPGWAPESGEHDTAEQPGQVTQGDEQQGPKNEQDPHFRGSPPNDPGWAPESGEPGLSH